MHFSKTVIINCAGTGSRLGLGVTKALVKIKGRTLIDWQLDLLEDVPDVRIVVGFNADQLIVHVRKRRPDVLFIFNHRYMDTGTGYSLWLAARHCTGGIISLDGDFRLFFALQEPCIGISSASSEEPLYAKMNGDHVTAFSFKEKSNFEWNGIVKTHASSVHEERGFLYPIIEKQLPLRAVNMNTCEIDTPKDFNRAVDWIGEYMDKRAHSRLGAQMKHPSPVNHG